MPFIMQHSAAYCKNYLSACLLQSLHFESPKAEVAQLELQQYFVDHGDELMITRMEQKRSMNQVARIASYHNYEGMAIEDSLKRGRVLLPAENRRAKPASAECSQTVQV
ncbi:hypothetical protein Ahy_A07g036054 isoform A [Arachis hypogaea]|uniref:Uncharacterized protein n=1 Tax=Arachis hypogaea TaxID=3818 RepID=A0A445CF43_ARAHY|nr:hypothetical protein Ahy_A07g036054 isoform A [Arachis hypogaea]